MSSGPQVSLAPGTVLLNTYEILELVGTGGMGAVYRARHRQLGTSHAVKVIRPELIGSQTARGLFVQEARVLRELRHEAIVQYDGLFQDESDRVYLVMEFAEGKRLADVLAERRALSEQEVWKLYGRLARGLAAAHARGVVHRDLSPDNIILDEGRAESAKLIDFGIAQAGDEAKGDQGFVGKLAYAAPEQLTGGEAVGPPADLYSLGLVLAAASGAPLPMGTSREEAITARRRVPKVARSIPKLLRREIEELLVPDPKARPSASDLIKRDLLRAQRAAPKREPRGVPVFLAGSALVGGILLAVGVWIAYGGGSVSDLLTALRGGGAAPLPAPTASAGAGAPRVEPTVSLAPARPTPVPNAGSVVRREPVPHPDPRGRRSTSGDEGWGPIHRDESEQIE